MLDGRRMLYAIQDQQGGNWNSGFHFNDPSLSTIQLPWPGIPVYKMLSLGIPHITQINAKVALEELYSSINILETVNVDALCTITSYFNEVNSRKVLSQYHHVSCLTWGVNTLDHS